MTQATTDRHTVMAEISRHLKIPGVQRFVQYGRDRSTARITMYLEGGTAVRLGPVDTLFSQAEFSKAILVGLGIMPTRQTTNEWRDLVGAIFVAGMDVEEDPDVTAVGRVLEWLRAGYADRAVPKDDEVIQAREPYTADDGVYVCADSFRKYVRLEHSDIIGPEELRAALRDIGAERVTVSFRRPAGGHSTASYYCVPHTALEGT